METIIDECKKTIASMEHPETDSVLSQISSSILVYSKAELLRLHSCFLQSKRNMSRIWEVLNDQIQRILQIEQSQEDAINVSLFFRFFLLLLPQLQPLPSLSPLPPTPPLFLTLTSSPSLLPSAFPLPLPPLPPTLTLPYIFPISPSPPSSLLLPPLFPTPSPTPPTPVMFHPPPLLHLFSFFLHQGFNLHPMRELLYYCSGIC